MITRRKLIESVAGLAAMALVPLGLLPSPVKSKPQTPVADDFEAMLLRGPVIGIGFMLERQVSILDGQSVIDCVFKASEDYKCGNEPLVLVHEGGLVLISDFIGN